MEREIARVQREDQRLGGKRPERVSAILATLQERLDAARRLRLARDQWSVKVTAFRSYRRAIAAPLADFRLMSAGLDDIKRLAGPAAAELPASGEARGERRAGAGAAWCRRPIWPRRMR